MDEKLTENTEPLCQGPIVDSDDVVGRWIMRCSMCGKLYYGVSKRSFGLWCPAPKDFARNIDYAVNQKDAELLEESDGGK